MKNKKLTLLCSIGLVLVLVLSTILAACAQEAAAPGAPTRITPQVPAQPATPAAPTTPAKPAPAPEAEVIKWKFQNEFAPGSIIANSMIAYADILKEMSGGRLEMDVFPSGAVIPEMEMFDGIRAGVCDMAMCSIGKWTGRVGPMADLQYNLPGGMQQPREGEVWMFDMGVEDMYKEILAGFDMYYMANVAVIQGDVLVSAKPVPTVEDLKGKIVRAMGTLEITFTNAGARTTTLPVGELYLALDTGAIDMCEWGNAEMMYAAGLHEVAKYWVWPPLVGFATNNMIISMKSWQALPDDLKVIVEIGKNEAIRRGYRASQKADTDVYNVIQSDHGVTVHYWDTAEYAKWAAYARPILGAMAEEDPTYAAVAGKLLEDYLVFLGYWE